MDLPNDLTDIEREIWIADIETRLGVELTEEMQLMFAEEIEELLKDFQIERRADSRTREKRES